MSDIFEQMNLNNHESIMFCNDEHCGLKAIIAVHNTVLGPALGGCRFYSYENEAEALRDVLRLSRGMTYKAGAAGMSLGGGKAVIIGDPQKLASEKLFRTFGRFVNSLGGRYITAEDVGTNVHFMEWVLQETNHVVGTPTYFGGSGNPAPYTAHGTFVAIKACLKKLTGNESLAGIRVAVEGAAGSVGRYLCKELYENGAKLYISDINQEGLKQVANECNATIVKCEDLYNLDVDVYAPCALGATINDKTIDQFKCTIIAGAANNQLENEITHAEKLKQRNILYAPDYIVNAGGLMVVLCCEILQTGADHAWQRTENIYHTLLKTFENADKENINPADAARRMVEERIRDMSLTKSIYKKQYSTNYRDSIKDSRDK